MPSNELVVPSETTAPDKSVETPVSKAVDENLTASAKGSERTAPELDNTDDSIAAAESVQVVPPPEAVSKETQPVSTTTPAVGSSAVVRSVTVAAVEPKEVSAKKREEPVAPHDRAAPAVREKQHSQTEQPQAAKPPEEPQQIAPPATSQSKEVTRDEKEEASQTPTPVADGGGNKLPPIEKLPTGGEDSDNENDKDPDETREAAQAELPDEDRTEVLNETREQPTSEEAAEVAIPSTKQEKRAIELAARIERDLDLKRRWEQREDEEDSMVAGNELIDHYRGFVANTAYRLLKQPTATVELEDVIQQGLEAFMKATQRWDGRGQLITFAGNRAYWAMYDLIAQDKHPVHIPSSTVDYLNTIWEQEAIRLHNGEPPLTDEEISELFDPPLPMKRHGTNMDVSSLRQAIAFINGTYSVETEIEERTHIESEMIMLATQERLGVDEEATNYATLPRIVELLEKYVEDAETERTRNSRRAGVRYLAMRMGFVDGSPMSLKEIAAQESVTDMGVRYCIKRCLDWLQAYFGSRESTP
jgi:RNA polymerase sigma factor (sigma-70 family)